MRKAVFLFFGVFMGAISLNAQSDAATTGDTTKPAVEMVNANDSSATISIQNSTSNPVDTVKPAVQLVTTPADTAKPVIPSESNVNTTASTSSVYVSPVSTDAIAPRIVVKPSQSFFVGLGAGMLKYYGDVRASKFKPGYELSISKNISPYLQANFYTVFGKLGVTEQKYPRNINFLSQIKTYGVSGTYNFNHFLPKKRTFSPFVTLGIESLEYLTKTDQYDQYGNKYYYWSDGSIRNMDENASGAAYNAIILKRDYTFETDVREQNLDGFGKYSERSVAFPIGIGTTIHVFDGMDARIGFTYHITATDYIDGVTKKSVGDRVGKKGTDKFMFTYISLHYNIIRPPKGLDTLGEDWFKDVDFLALDTEDSDGDGIMDLYDACAGTPSGAPIDEVGCPKDTDADGVADYQDDELNSRPGAIVNVKGVELTDSLIYLWYQAYFDSTGEFWMKRVGDDPRNLVAGMSGGVTQYAVQLGVFSKGMSPATMSRLLSIDDIKSTAINDSTTAYTVGDYGSYTAADKRKKEMIEKGFPDSKVVGIRGNDIVPVTEEMAKANGTYVVPGSSALKEVLASGNGVIRVQLGAYKKRLSKNAFPGVPEVFEIQTEDGLFKYASGAFNNMTDAANRKAQLIGMGYTGAFITAYKEGQRVTLTSVGATMADKKKKEDITESSKPVNAFDKSKVVFKVQVGVYKGDPPADKMIKLLKLGEVKREITPTGLYRYVIGEFSDYNKAQALKEQFVSKGIDDAFVIAFFNGQFISVQEAIEISK